MATKSNHTTKSKTDKGQTDDNRVAARREFSYGGARIDVGQIFALTGMKNDERLLRLGFVIPTRIKGVACSECGAVFVRPGALTAHGENRHTTRTRPRPEMAPQMPGESDFDFERREQAFQEMVARQEDLEEQNEESRLERDAPLNWENTEAARREADL